jgi:O-antigen ligase
MAGEEPGRVAESGAPPPSARIALWILIALAALSPWPFGSTEPGAVRAVTLIALATAALVALAQARRGAVCLPHLPLWPAAILVAVGFIQLVPVPAGLLAIVAPGSAGVWHPNEPAAAALLTARARPISIYPAATTSWLGTTGGLLALAVLAVPALGRRRTMIAAAWTVVGAGTLVAVYGIVARTLFGSLLYGYLEVPTVSPLGPFVNKNHFAGYVEMAALLALGLGRGLWRQTASASASGVASPRPAVLVAFGAVAAMALGVLVSLSRGGALGLLSGLATFVVVDAATSRHQGGKSKVLGLAAIALLLAVVVAVLPGEAHERLFRMQWRQDQSALFRLATWKDSTRAVLASPLVGQGMGAFVDVLPRYKTAAGPFRVEHPENEMIEVAVEGGLLALAAAATAIVGGLRLVVRGIRGHRDRVVRGIVTGAVSGVVGLCVHGLVDFNLRIPSNAILFVVLWALAMAPMGSVEHRGPRRFALGGAIVLVAFAYSRSAWPWPVLRDARALAVKAQAGDPLRVSMADRRVREYLGRRPADPEGWLLAAWTARGRGAGTAEAAGLARHAVALDPAHPAVAAAAARLLDRGPTP